MTWTVTQSNCVTRTYEHNTFEFVWEQLWKDCEKNVFEQGLFRLGCTKATKDAAAGKLDGLSHSYVAIDGEFGNSGDVAMCIFEGPKIQAFEKPR